MSAFRPVERPTAAEITAEWDQIARVRQDQFDAKSDISIRHVIEPAILRALRARNARGPAIDVGCGAGHLTRGLAEFAERPVGVDPSTVSIGLAKKSHADTADFVSASAEEYAAEHEGAFNLLVSSMVMMDTPDLDDFVAACARLLGYGGLGVLTTVHPFFWPLYWGYQDEPWFNYSLELFVRGNFRTSVEQITFETTHAHRPLEMQVEALTAAGLRLLELEELWPDNGVVGLYDEPWKHPRFLMYVVRREEVVE